MSTAPSGRRAGQRLDPAAVERAGQAAARGLRAHGVRAIPESAADRIDAYLCGTHADLTIAGQAAQLGVPRASVRRRRERLIRQGRIDPRDRRGRPPITAAESAAIARLIQDGYTYRAIAAMRQISPYRVVRMVQAMGGRPQRRTPVYTAADVQRIFGICNQALSAWLDRGWLEREAQHRPRARYRWTRADLCQFIRLRAAWPAYAVSAITDPDMQRLARAARAAAGGRWMTTKEIAALIPLPVVTLKYWVRRGYLADHETMTYGPARWYWLRDGEALPPPPTSPTRRPTDGNPTRPRRHAPPAG